MTEIESNQEALMDALNSVQEVKIGDLVKGEVLSIDEKNQVIVGIEGAGVEGVVPAKELGTGSAEDLVKDIKRGDIIDLVVIATIGKDKENGSWLLSKRRIQERKVWDELVVKAEAGEVIEAPVKDVVRGGLVVDAGVRGFVPASMVENHFVDNLGAYKGKTMSFKIIEIEPSENRLILSHKAIAAAEAAEKRAEILATILPGDVVEGRVARLTNFGAFIDLGGVDGLVHISQIAHHRVNKPSDELEVGQEIKAKVLSVDASTGRIALSIKDTLAGPWDDIEEKAAPGTVLDGTVKRLTTFGAFVEVFPGVEGLVHISQISHNRIATPNEVLKEGQAIKVKVLEVNPTDHRLALSIKALEEKPAVEGEKAAPAENEHYEMPEEKEGFTMGDILGDALKKEDK